MHSSSIGEIPQDLKFGGERTKTFIGKRTRIREYVTINRGTKELGETRVGSDCLLMASTHVAHDCIVGDNVIMSNLSTLGGHVEVGDWAILGARMSTYMTNVERWDHTQIADYDYMQPFCKEMLEKYDNEAIRNEAIAEYGNGLRKDLQFRIADLDADASKWFKMVYTNPKRFGVMLTEREAK